MLPLVSYCWGGEGSRLGSRRTREGGLARDQTLRALELAYPPIGQGAGLAPYLSKDGAKGRVGVGCEYGLAFPNDTGFPDLIGAVRDFI